jgi:hypothetical protein
MMKVEMLHALRRYDELLEVGFFVNQVDGEDGLV